MKDWGYIGLGATGFSAFTLLSLVGHLWLPKTPFLWGLVQFSGVLIFWAIACVALLLLGIWCVMAAASAHSKAELPFGWFQLGQALMPALAGFLFVLLINGVALWLAL